MQFSKTIIYFYLFFQEREGSMRSIVGLILNDEDKAVSEEERQRITAKGFQITKFPEVEHVVYASFPHNCFLSVLIAIHKLLPKFREYIKVISSYLVKRFCCYFSVLM